MENNGNEPSKNGTEKLFTQDEVNSIVSERLDRERRKFQVDLERQNAQDTEIRELKTLLETERADRLREDEERKALHLNNAIISELEKARVHNVNTVLPLFRDKAKFNDSGDVVIEDMAITEYVASWSNNNPWAIKPKEVEVPRGFKPGIPITRGELSEEGKAEQLHQQIRRAFEPKGYY